MQIAYCLEATGLCGGIRVVLEHLNGLAARGHEVALFALWAKPKWFQMRPEVEFCQFPGYEEMRQELVKRGWPAVATWWKTAPVVHSAVGKQGFYLVQDIESSYCQQEDEKARVMTTYRLGLRLLTEGEWTHRQLEAMGCEVHANVGIGIDHEVYRVTETEVDRGRVIAHPRNHWLKDFHTLATAARHIGANGFSIVTFSMEPKIKLDGVPHIHLTNVGDQEVAKLYSSGGCLVHAAAHEGFGLPILEAMACGLPVACTEAEGNLEFCQNGTNALVVPKRDGVALGEAAVSLLQDRNLAMKLAKQGMKTAQQYRWDRVIDKLEEALQ